MSIISFAFYPCVIKAILNHSLLFCANHSTVISKLQRWFSIISAWDLRPRGKFVFGSIKRIFAIEPSMMYVQSIEWNCGWIFLVKTNKIKNVIFTLKIWIAGLTYRFLMDSMTRFFRRPRNELTKGYKHSQSLNNVKWHVALLWLSHVEKKLRQNCSSTGSFGWRIGIYQPNFR